MRSAITYIFIVSLLFSCHRKRHVITEEVPDLPPDTVVQIVDRCNYQYLSTNPAKAKKQLDNIVRELDHLIIQYDKAIASKKATLREKSTTLKTLNNETP